MEHVLLHCRENEKARTVMMDCISNILKSSRSKANYKLNITESLLLVPHSQSNCLSRREDIYCKEACFSLLPALKKEYNITSCSKLLSFIQHLWCFTFSDFTRSIYHWLYREEHSAREGSIRSQQQQHNRKYVLNTTIKMRIACIMAWSRLPDCVDVCGRLLVRPAAKAD